MKKSKINIDGVPGQDLSFLSLKCSFLLLLVFALHLPQEILEAIRNQKTWLQLSSKIHNNNCWKNRFYLIIWIMNIKTKKISYKVIYLCK